MVYISQFLEYSLTEARYQFGTTLAFLILHIKWRLQAMELLGSIFFTGLGLFGGLFFLWKSHPQ